MAKPPPSSWAELPEDILGQVLLRLPSLDDRVRLRAVCRPWRAGAAAQRHPRLPPPLPWLALRDGSLVDLHGALVRCAPIVREGVFTYLAVDNLAFLVHDDGGCSLMNPLSGLTLPLPKLASVVSRAINKSEVYRQLSRKWAFAKAKLSSPLDSMLDPLVAVSIIEGQHVAVSSCKQQDAIGIRMCPEGTRGPQRINATDIAFLHGKLYALTDHEGLHVIQLDACHLSEQESSPGFAFNQCIADNPEQQQVYFPFDRKGPVCFVMRYLAESNGKLLMIRRWMHYPQTAARLGLHDKTFVFEVFKADLTTAPGRWTKVDNLDGHAVFLGWQCSKSIVASHCGNGVQENCIYFMHRVFDNPSNECFGPCVDPLGDSGVYHMKDEKILLLLPEAVMEELRRKQQFLTWFFPAYE
ncbi:hypothetical protein ACP70R_018057 [Stipagrostis hirtigluma subsp. patula]